MECTPSKRTGFWGGETVRARRGRDRWIRQARDQPMIHVFGGLKQSGEKSRSGWATAGLKVAGLRIEREARASGRSGLLHLQPRKGGVKALGRAWLYGVRLKTAARISGRVVPGTMSLEWFSRECTGCSQQAERSEYPTQQQARHTDANRSKRPRHQWLASAPMPGHERVGHAKGCSRGCAGCAL